MSPTIQRDDCIAVLRHEGCLGILVSLSIMRIVIDTNALVAARWSPKGSASQLLDLCIGGQVTVLLTPEIERENRVILRKVKPSEQFWERLERLYSNALPIKPGLRVTVSEDPGDNKFLECAVAGQADYIISSDRHLLDHDGYTGIRICKARQFLEENPFLRG